MRGTFWIIYWLIIVQVLTISAFEVNRNDQCSNTRIYPELGANNGHIICLPRCSKTTQDLNSVKHVFNPTQRAVFFDRHTQNSDSKTLYITPDRISNKTVHLYWFNKLPKCQEYVTISEYRIIEHLRLITQISNRKSESFTPIWIDVTNTPYCIDCTGSDVTHCQSITLCKEDLNSQRHQIKILQRKFGEDLLVEGGTTSAWLALLSAIVLALTIAVYIFLWKDQNIHGWTQVSFLIALLLMYFCAALRRLISFNTLQKKQTFATMLEALEDLGCVASSSNLVALSFDLFYTLWRSLPTQSKITGWRRFAITTAVAWSLGIFIMVLSLFYRTEVVNYDDDEDIVQLGEHVEYLKRILERFLCIQMFGMVSALWLSILQLGLLFLNLLLFIGSLAILYQKQKRLLIAMENVNRTKLIKTWARRFTKIFLLMGLWWPMSVICLAQCMSIFTPTMSAWIETLATFYLKPAPIHVQIPWHVHLVSNYLAAQAAIICFLLVIWNPRIVKGLRAKLTGNHSTSFTS